MCDREEERVCGVECEQAGVGGFRSAMNPLSRNAAESDERKAGSGLGTWLPVLPGQAQHGARELCCLLRLFFRLLYAPAAATTAAAAPPVAANY